MTRAKKFLHGSYVSCKSSQLLISDSTLRVSVHACLSDGSMYREMWLRRIACIPSRIAGEKDFGPHDRESAHRDELSD
jgi:hypothetical protein